MTAPPTTARRLLATAAVALLVPLELALARTQLPGRTLLLLLLAFTQLALVVALPMRLAREPRALQLAFMLPLLLAALYSAGVVGEALLGAHGP